jgi:hypothetical protein
MTEDSIIEKAVEMMPAANPILEAAIAKAHSPALVDQDPISFQAALAGAELNWETLLDWIRAHLVKDVDYGIIPAGPKASRKPSLWKPGAEKICGRLGWVADFPDVVKYVDVVVTGAKLDQVLLRCYVMNSNGLKLGMGSGAHPCTTTQSVYEGSADKRRKTGEQDVYDLNKAVKMAEKSAFIDAVLRSVGISAIFTQDYPKEGVDHRPVGENQVELSFLEAKAQELGGDKWEQWLGALASRKFQIADGDWTKIPTFRVHHAVAALEEASRQQGMKT